MDQLYRSRRESRLFFFCFKLMFLLNIMLIYDEPPLAGGTQMQWGGCLIRRKVWLQISSIYFFSYLAMGSCKLNKVV